MKEKDDINCQIRLIKDKEKKKIEETVSSAVKDYRSEVSALALIADHLGPKTFKEKIDIITDDFIERVMKSVYRDNYTILKNAGIFK